MKINKLIQKRPTISFEIFPPKNHEGDISKIYTTIDELASLNPDFISVTYGAMGSTINNTVNIVSKIKNDYNIEAVAHLSCIGSTKENITKILDELKSNNINNILALRGDFPSDYDPSNDPREFSYASDLTAFISKNYPDDFCVSGACYPEVHTDAKNMHEDLINLKKKVDAGAKYLVTQIFFDNDYYYRFVREARKMGIDVPILAGIMPAINPKSLKNIAKVSGCSIPYRLTSMIERFSDNPEAMREIGMNYAAYQIIDLMTNDVDGIHIYTMNKPDIAKDILKRIEHVRKEYTKA
ncbi:MAG: methylenetetrahydrofolate reductase [NAD(P)H] [Thomasclavelia sp.]|nr:methylenetetrahydrofolate reductase [NAD(P)H] [Thomasclavelia sp.]